MCLQIYIQTLKYKLSVKVLKASAIEFEPIQIIIMGHKILPKDSYLLELEIYLMLEVLNIHLFE